MAKSNRDQWLVQRRVTTGEVIVVQRERRKSEPVVEAKALAPAQEAEGAGESYRWWEQDEAEVVPPAKQSSSPWPYTPAPQRNACKSCTGRLMKTSEQR